MVVGVISVIQKCYIGIDRIHPHNLLSETNSVLRLVNQRFLGMGLETVSSNRCRRLTEFSFEFPDKESVAFWVVDFSWFGWKVEAAESALPLMASPACSVVDFWESGWRGRPVR